MRILIGSMLYSRCNSLMEGLGFGHLTPFTHSMALFWMACSLSHDVMFSGISGHSSIGRISDLYRRNYTSSGHPENLFGLVRVLPAIFILSSTCDEMPVFVIFSPSILPSLALVLWRLRVTGLILAAGMIRNLFVLVLIFQDSSNLFISSIALSVASLMKLLRGVMVCVISSAYII